MATRLKLLSASRRLQPQPFAHRRAYLHPARHALQHLGLLSHHRGFSSSCVDLVLNAYRDSIQLMRIQGEISQLPGVDSASVKLGTPAAVEELQAAGHVHVGAAIEKAGPLDVLISVAGTTKGAVADAISAAKGMLEASPESQKVSLKQFRTV